MTLLVRESLARSTSPGSVIGKLVFVFFSAVSRGWLSFWVAVVCCVTGGGGGGMLGASDMLRRCMPLSFISISFMDGLRCERVLDTVEGNWLVGASGTVTISGIVVVSPNACWVSGAEAEVRMMSHRT